MLCFASLSASAKIQHPWLFFPTMRAAALVAALNDDESIVGVFEIADSSEDIWHTGNRSLEFVGLSRLRIRYHLVPLRCLERLHGENIPDKIFLWLGEGYEGIKVSVNDKTFSMLMTVPGNRYILALNALDGTRLLPDVLDATAAACSDEEIATLPEKCRRIIQQARDDPSIPKKFLSLAEIQERVYGLAGNRMGSLPFHEWNGLEARADWLKTEPEQWEENPFVQDVSGLIHLWLQWTLNGSETDVPPIQFETQTEFGQIFLECLKKSVSSQKVVPTSSTSMLAPL